MEVGRVELRDGVGYEGGRGWGRGGRGHDDYV